MKENHDHKPNKPMKGNKNAKKRQQNGQKDANKPGRE